MAEANAESSFPSKAATIPGSGDEDYRGKILLKVQVVWLALSVLAVALRFFAKKLFSKRFALEDWLMLVGCLLYVAYGAVVIWGAAEGDTGKEPSKVTVPRAIVSLKAWYICEVLYPVVSAAIRSSICILIKRIPTEKVHVNIIFYTMILVNVLTFPYCIAVAFQCTPPNHFWLQILPEHKGSCIGPAHIPNATIAYSALCALSDCVVGVLPLFMLWHLQVSTKTKISLCVALVLGMSAGAILLARIPLVKKIALSAEFLDETVEFAILSVTEPGIGIVAGSAPTFLPLLRKLMGGSIWPPTRPPMQAPSSGRSHHCGGNVTAGLGTNNDAPAPHAGESRGHIFDGGNGSDPDVEMNPMPYGVSCQITGGFAPQPETSVRSGINVETSIEVRGYSPC